MLFVLTFRLEAKIKTFFGIQQIGIDYFPRMRGESHLGSIGVILKIIRELIQLTPEMRRKVPRRQVTQNAPAEEPQPAKP